MIANDGVPAGKTICLVLHDIYETELKEGDVVFVDGYVRIANDRPYAIVFRVSDGMQDLVPIRSLQLRKLR